MDPLRLARTALHVLTEADAGDTPAQTALPARIRRLTEDRLRATASGTVALHRLRTAPGGASTTMAEIVLADEADRDPAFAAALRELLEELGEAPGAPEASPPERDAGRTGPAAEAAPAEAAAPARAPGAAPDPEPAAPQPAQAAPQPLPGTSQPWKAGGDGPGRAGPEAAPGPQSAPAGPARAVGRTPPAGRAVRASFLAGAAATTALAATGGRVPGFLWPLLLVLAVTGMACARSAVRRPFRPLPAAGLLLNLAVLALLLADAVTGRAF